MHYENMLSTDGYVLGCMALQHNGSMALKFFWGFIGKGAVLFFDVEQWQLQNEKK